MRKGKVLLVMVAVLAMAGAAGAQTSIDYTGYDSPGTDIEGVMLGNVMITSPAGDVRYVEEGSLPAGYGAPNGGASVLNGCIASAGGFTDIATKEATGKHKYEFNFFDGSGQAATVEDFQIVMYDFGDYNPHRVTNHRVEVRAHDQGGSEIGMDYLEFPSSNAVNPAPLYTTGDACDAGEGQPGNHLFSVAASGIASVVLEVMTASDPNIGFGAVEFTLEEPPCESELIAGQYDNVGQVVVTDDCDGVKVKLTANEGYAFSEIHVGAGCVGDENIPVNKKGNPKVGQFYFSEEYPDFWLTEQEVTIPLDVAQPCEGETDIDVAVHAVVKYLTPECQQPRAASLHATANTSDPNSDPTPATADIYRIVPTGPVETLLTDLQFVPGTDLYPGNLNGNAFDGIYFYFSRFDWSGPQLFDLYPSELFYNNLETGDYGYAGPITGASGGTVHGGYYYYFMERTDDLYRLPLNGDGTVGSAELVNDNVLDDAVYPGGRLAFGDIAIRSDGKMFGSATRLPATGSSGPGVFFSMNIDGTGYTELPFNGGDIGAGGVQIAFGADGVLYGVNARTPFQLISIDPSNGDVNVISNLERAYSDLATGDYVDFCDVPDETAWGNGCYPDTGIQFSNDNGWAMYFKYSVNTDSLACEVD